MGQLVVRSYPGSGAGHLQSLITLCHRLTCQVTLDKPQPQLDVHTVAHAHSCSCTQSCFPDLGSFDSLPRACRCRDGPETLCTQKHGHSKHVGVHGHMPTAHKSMYKDTHMNTDTRPQHTHTCTWLCSHCIFSLPIEIHYCTRPTGYGQLPQHPTS